ncbi:MAG: HU family DNA-binding protein [Planctomycetes bacterium]|nr:HU family DNA-binding protein [Planctomycetota bacterium]
MAKRAKSAAKARTKTEIYRNIADSTELTRKQVAAVFDSMSTMIKKDLSSRGPGSFTIPGLLKVTVVKKPATKEREGVNPFTGEPTIFKAKPARRVVKARALKGLKDMV